MNDIAEQRPTFFEGEYLGADDLQQIVVYVRDQMARHALGGHSWGIAAGLDLVEQPAPSGGIDVYLLPGYAVDGYGRAVIVVNPLRLTVDLFAGLVSGPIPVWIRYDEGGTKGVRPGFETCTAADAYARVAESFALKAGYLQAISQRQSGISVAGETVDDAREAARVFNDKGPIICDAAVPYQDLPLDDQSKQWFIPLGLVGWTSGVPGSLRALTDDERMLARRQRRYLGVVAESVLAADGLIRLRHRGTPWQSGKTTDQLCGPDDVADPSHDGDLKVCQSGAAEFNELVWIEGRVRITDDARLLGGRLEFRDKKGTDYLGSGAQPGSVPLLLERKDRSGNADLRLLLGTAKTGSNRLVIAQAGDPTADPDPCNAVHFDSAQTKLVVQDDGKVGIGTETPDQIVDVEDPNAALIHLRSASGPHDLFVGADDKAGVVAVLNADDLRIRAGGTSPTDDNFTQITVKSTGQVGFGTKTPDPNRLVTLEEPHGNGTYLIARTNPPSGSGQDPHQVLIGADSSGAMISAMTPNTDLQLRGGNNAGAVWIKDNTYVGVGTNVPAERLDVRGNVKLGWGGELFAPGCAENLRIIAGNVDSGGGRQAGSGFSCSRSAQGRYRVNFDNPFTASPVVLANVTDVSADDDVAMVQNLSNTGFDLHVKDFSLGHLEDHAFSFVVFGLR